MEFCLWVDTSYRAVFKRESDKLNLQETIKKLNSLLTDGQLAFRLQPRQRQHGSNNDLNDVHAEREDPLLDTDEEEIKMLLIVL